MDRAPRVVLRGVLEFLPIACFGALASLSRAMATNGLPELAQATAARRVREAMRQLPQRGYMPPQCKLRRFEGTERPNGMLEAVFKCQRLILASAIRILQGKLTAELAWRPPSPAWQELSLDPQVWADAERYFLFLGNEGKGGFEWCQNARTPPHPSQMLECLRYLDSVPFDEIMRFVGGGSVVPTRRRRSDRGPAARRAIDLMQHLDASARELGYGSAALWVQLDKIPSERQPAMRLLPESGLAETARRIAANGRQRLAPRLPLATGESLYLVWRDPNAGVTASTEDECRACLAGMAGSPQWPGVRRASAGWGD